MTNVLILIVLVLVLALVIDLYRTEKIRKKKMQSFEMITAFLRRRSIQIFSFHEHVDYHSVNFMDLNDNEIKTYNTKDGTVKQIQ